MTSTKGPQPAISNQASLSRPSDLGAHPAAAASPAVSAGLTRGPAEAPQAVPPPRQLPPVMHVAFRGGEAVELLQDQLYADRVLIRAGERGRTVCPSSQAAAWVVHFPRLGAKTRVVPEPLLKRV